MTATKQPSIHGDAILIKIFQTPGQSYRIILDLLHRDIIQLDDIRSSVHSIETHCLQEEKEHGVSAVAAAASNTAMMRDGTRDEHSSLEKSEPLEENENLEENEQEQVEQSTVCNSSQDATAEHHMNPTEPGNATGDDSNERPSSPRIRTSEDGSEIIDDTAAATSSSTTISNEEGQATQESPSFFTHIEKFDKRWVGRLNELRVFKLDRGHCVVPKIYPDNRKLGLWVNHQRTEYNKFKEGKPSFMTEDRFAALDHLGFAWTLQHRVGWEVRFEQLRQFHMEQGHCIVPKKYVENPPLGIWVNHQRTGYKKFVEGKHSHMTEQRKEALDSLGFACMPPESWEVRFDDLREYALKYGDCRVPRNFAENTSLSNWVIRQRQYYKKFKEGKQKKITPERIRRLDEIGFIWSPKQHSKKTGV